MFPRENTLSIYCFQNSGSITLGAQRLFMHGLRFGKVFIVTHMKAFFLPFSLVASTLVTSAFGQRSVGLQPTLKPPTTCKKNPLVTRFNTTLSQYLVFYLSHEEVSKSNGLLCSHGCSTGLQVQYRSKVS